MSMTYDSTQATGRGMIAAVSDNEYGDSFIIQQSSYRWAYSPKKLYGLLLPSNQKDLRFHTLGHKNLLE